MKIIKNIFTTNRLYLSIIAIVVLYIFGFFIDLVYLFAKIASIIIIFFLIIDFALLFLIKKQKLLILRELPEKLSNGDENQISIYLKSFYSIMLNINIIDEIPIQFQVRNFNIKTRLNPGEEKKLFYILKPYKRGEYIFGNIHVYITGNIGLFSRRYSYQHKNCTVPVYPSFLQMRKYELLAVSNRLTEAGVKRIRKLGFHTEFDQIRDYVKGDDYRTINWKATAKKTRLMVNQYQDEKSQQVYNVIDMGRIMKMPFEQMSLLDYAINSSLIISNTAILKHDKAGLITFNTKINTFLKAERTTNTIQKILEALYNQYTLFGESNFELLYTVIKRQVTHRSLIILYTNFESISSLNRQAGILKKLSKNHLLLVVLFQNTEINKLVNKNSHNLDDVYVKIIAEKFICDKSLIIKELNKCGIHTILTKPHNLSVKLINKYLEFKDLGLI